MVGPPTFFVSMMQAPGFAAERVASLRLISSGGAGVGDGVRRRGVARVRRAGEAHVRLHRGADDHHRRPHDRRGRGARRRQRRAARARARGVRRLSRSPRRPRRRSPPTAGSAPATSPTIDATGAIEIVGRLKDVIIRGGENISTAEVEQVLEAHPDVRHAVAVGEADRADGRAGRRVRRGRRRRSISTRAGRGSSTGASPGSRPPSGSIVVDALPLLPTGKPDRAALRARVAPPA